MRQTTRPRRQATRIAVPTTKPRNPVVQAVISGFGTMIGKRHRELPRDRDLRLARMDVDQRVRELGEW